jgi:4'-phosphopantetheinyl transferase
MNRHSFEIISQNDYTLNSNRIDIWQFSLATLHPAAFSLLNKEEKIRAERYYFPRHQRRFTMARAIMRSILARYIQQEPEDLCFTTNEYGKPEINNPSHIQFNLSHSQDLALLAVGKEFPLGIDLEFLSKRPYQQLADHSFSKSESKVLLSLAPEVKALYFFHIWSQKEAFIKSSGLGLSYPTQDFSVPCTLPSNELVFDEKHDCYWQIRSFMPQIACCAALCSNPLVTTIRYKVFSECPLL